MATSDRDQAFVTLATTDSYALGALVLGRSLRRVGTSRQLCVMVTSNLSQNVRSQLGAVFDHMEEVNVLDSHDTVNLSLLTRPDLGVTFTKLHCWRLTQYKKCVFMDADTLVLQNIDELFVRDELSAAPDVGWPDCFNSGVFVFVPSLDTYQAVLAFACEQGSFDGGDQGLLNLYFRDWSTKDIARHLPFIYNCVSTTFYTYQPAFKQFGQDVKVVHFIGAQKPWHSSYNTATGHVDGSTDQSQHTFLQQWWQIFMEDVQNTLQSGLRELVHLYHLEPPRIHHQESAQPPAHPSGMTAPYVPPEVETYYEPVHQEGAPAERTMVENKDDRGYSHHESFYTEAPMGRKEEDMIHEEIHHVEHFHKTLNVFEAAHQPETVESESETVGFPGSEKETYNHPEPEPPHDVSEHVPAPVQETEVKQHFDHGDGNECTKMENIENESTPPSEVFLEIQPSETGSGYDSSSEWDSEVDITDGVASVQMLGPVGYSESQLADQRRQYMWEKGQIDYTGIDAFEHIQKKLDQTMTTKPDKPPSFPS